ncbi:hypothetical protein FRX31_030877 [Thalictrum thalictroides]|uniref:DUF4283 domain-containing protein n=1 Tax=Thalictrum thalictroides TaxID=46969 RepID=A0A7J6V423_THATH|nr:hypothetical protein FRX31_030877 [Thalictrum thalictroides]
MRLKDKESVIEKEPWTVIGHLLIMLPYDGNVNTDELRLERVPLWMSVKGLLLQHMHMDTVQMIALAAGEVDIVLPQIIVPRTAEGFRAKVRVLVNTPLIQGCEVNTVGERFGLTLSTTTSHQLIVQHVCVWVTIVMHATSHLR